MAAPRPRLEMKSIFIDGEKKSLARFGIVKRLRYSILDIDKHHSFLFLTWFSKSLIYWAQGLAAVAVDECFNVALAKNQSSINTSKWLVDIPW